MEGGEGKRKEDKHEAVTSDFSSSSFFPHPYFNPHPPSLPLPSPSSCRVGARLLTEQADTLETSDLSSTSLHTPNSNSNGSSSNGSSSGSGEGRVPVQVMVPEIRTQSSEGKLIVHYKVVCALSGGGGGEGGREREVVVLRRYRDFDKLDRLVRSAFAGSHLLNSLPCLPIKILNPFTDQSDPIFIDARRQELEMYLKRLIQMPKASSNPDLLRFFSLHPVSGQPLDPGDLNMHVELRF